MSMCWFIYCIHMSRSETNSLKSRKQKLAKLMLLIHFIMQYSEAIKRVSGLENMKENKQNI